MPNAPVVLFASIGTAFLALFLVMLVRRFLQIPSLGPVLWRSETKIRWLASIWLLVLGLRIASFILDSRAGKPPSSFNLVSTLLYGALFIITLFPPNLVQIHENGVLIGLLVFPWSSLQSWGWGPMKNPDGSNPMTSLNIDARPKGALCLKTNSARRFIYTVTSNLNTGVKFTPEVDALMKQKLPAVESPTSDLI